MIDAVPKPKRRWQFAPGWWGLLPSLLLLTIFVLYPLIQVFQISSLKWDGVIPGKFIGLDNYANLLKDPDLGRSLVTTLIFAALTLPAFVILAALTAMELEGTRLERVVKAALFLPGLWTIGASAIGWYTLYAPDYGVLATLTNGALALPWGDKGWAALILIALFTIWQHIGYAVLVVSAGLKAFPRKLLRRLEWMAHQNPRCVGASSYPCCAPAWFSSV